MDTADLGLDGLDFSDAELMESEAFLSSGDFSLSESDLRDITSDLDFGWDDVTTDMGRDIEAGTLENFDSVPWDSGFDANTFEDHGMSDFGSDFGGGMDFDW